MEVFHVNATIYRGRGGGVFPLFRTRGGTHFYKYLIQQNFRDKSCYVSRDNTRQRSDSAQDRHDALPGILLKKQGTGPCSPGSRVRLAVALFGVGGVAKHAVLCSNRALCAYGLVCCPPPASSACRPRPTRGRRGRRGAAHARAQTCAGTRGMSSCPGRAVPCRDFFCFLFTVHCFSNALCFVLRWICLSPADGQKSKA